MSSDKVGNSMLGKWEYVMLALTTLGVLYLVMCQMQAAKEGFSSTYGNTQRWDGGFRTHPGFDNPPPDRFVSSMSAHEAPSWHMSTYDGDTQVVELDNAPAVVTAAAAASLPAVATAEGFRGNAHAYERMSNLERAGLGANVTL